MLSITLEKSGVTETGVQLYKSRMWLDGRCVAEPEHAEPHDIAWERAKKWAKDTSAKLYEKTGISA